MLTRFHRSGWIIYLLVILLMLSISCKLQPATETPPVSPDPTPPQPVNNAPVINYMTAQEEVATSSESEVHCVATDKDNDALTYSWSASAGTINGEGDIVTWTAPDEPGVYDIGVTVADGNGGEASDSIVVTVASKPNRLPDVKLMILLEGQEEAFEAGEEPIKVKREAVITIKCVAKDPDGDKLSYAWAATAGRVVGEGNAVTFYTLTSKGDQAVTVTVTDSNKGRVIKSAYFDVPCCGSQ